MLNSDDEDFGGSGAVHNKSVRTHKKPLHGFDQSITITLPPMSTLYFEVPTKRTRKAAADKTGTAEPAKKTATRKTAAKTTKPAKTAAPEKAPAKRGRKPKAEPSPAAEAAPEKPVRKPRARKAVKTEE